MSASSIRCADAQCDHPSTRRPPKKQKRSADNLNSRLALTIKSGKYQLGYKSTLKSMRNGKGAFGLSAFWPARPAGFAVSPC